MTETSRFERFSERARRVLTNAGEEAMARHDSSICPEHILLALLREDKGGAATIFSKLGISPAIMHSVIESWSVEEKEIGLSPQAKTTLELAMKESTRLGHHYIGTEHLVLAMLRQTGEASAKEKYVGDFRAVEALFKGIGLALASSQAEAICSEGQEREDKKSDD